MPPDCRRAFAELQHHLRRAAVVVIAALVLGAPVVVGTVTEIQLTPQQKNTQHLL